jgi:hypothetical protein
MHVKIQEGSDYRKEVRGPTMQLTSPRNILFISEPYKTAAEGIQETKKGFTRLID